MVNASSNGERTIPRLLFLTGLFSLTKINLGGSIAISELVMVFLAPFVLARLLPHMRRDGLGVAISLIGLWLGGAIFADWYNGTYVQFALKGIATPIALGACFICMYALLRKDLSNFKWYLFGAALSYVISTFFFSRASSLGLDWSEEEALARTVGYKLYWILLAIQFLSLPFVGWYLKTPFFYTIVTSALLAVMALFVGVRSTFMIWSLCVLLFIIGKRSPASMMRIKRHFAVLLVSAFAVVVIVKVTYSFAVHHGWLGESEMKKYELQTRGGDSPLKMLMAGRAEFFVGIFASLESPIIGRGSWAQDTTGVYPEFVYKYGAVEDYEVMMSSQRILGGLYFIPFHTHVITYWMWHGVFGLLFWLYFFYNVVGTFKNRMHVAPELFGYFVVTLPTFAWDFFFSPLGARINEAMLLVLCLMVKKLAGAPKLTYGRNV